MTTDNQVDEVLLNEAFLDRIGSEAHWKIDYFKNTLAAVVERFNNAKHVSALCAHFRLRKSDCTFAFKDNAYPLIDDSKCQISGRRLQMCVGSVKAVDSAARKVAGMKNWLPGDTGGNPMQPHARYVTDMLRATVIASDPFVL